MRSLRNAANVLSDICPILWPQRIERSGKHDAFLHSHVLTLVLDEFVNDVIHGLARQTLVAQNALNRKGNPPRTLRSFPMLGFEITDRCRLEAITRLELLDNQVLPAAGRHELAAAPIDRVRHQVL